MSAESMGAETTSGRAALQRSPSVRNWVVAELTSSAGDQFFVVALAVIASAHGPVAAGMVIGLGSVPAALATLVSGAVVDRLGYRTAMLVADVGRCVVLAVSVVLWWGEHTSVATLAVTAVLMGLAGSLYEPAAVAVAPSLAPERDLPALFAARMTAVRAGMLAGAPLAGVAVAAWGGAVALGIDAVTFYLTALMVFRLPSRARPASTPSKQDGNATSFLRSVRDGYRYILRTPALITAIVLIGLLEFAATGPVNVGLPLLAQTANWSATTVGVMLGAFALGAVIGPALTVWVRRRNRAALPAGVVLTSIAFLGLSLGTAQPAPVVMSTVALLLGTGSSWLASTIVPALQARCDPAYLGRLGGALTFTFESVTPLSALAVGFAASAVGNTAVFVAAGLLGITACTLLVIRPTLRALSRDW